MAQTIILRGEPQRDLACRIVRQVPADFVVRIAEPSRTGDQNAKMWAMLSDISRAKPEGRKHTPEIWKQIFMHSLGHKVRFELGLDGEPFPVGLHSSRLTKRQFSDLITFIIQKGDEWGVIWTDPRENPYV